MFKFLPGPIKGLCSALIFVLNTVFWCSLIYVFVVLKLILPLPSARRFCTRVMVAMGECWSSVNSFEAGLMHEIEWDVQGIDGLRRDRSYLISANHQSWVDIVILQQVFNRRIPFMRFFLKSELIYVPFLGLAWWALDFPFMKRYSKNYLEKHPEKRGEDLKTTRRACDRFRGGTISIINFLEGTRFTPAKHKKSKSPYRHLLAPKVGGIAFVLEVMGNQFDSLLDVTIHYPEGAPSLWELFSGRMNKVQVRVSRIEIPPALLSGSYLEDAAFRAGTQEWVREIWQRKDQLLEEMGRRR